jgi:hypothetical protein
LGKVSASIRREKHAADEEWVDFARGLGDDVRRGELQAHLASGCRRCAATLDLWQSAVAVSRRDRAYEPPDALVRQLRGSFSLSRPAKVPSLVATLVFDSFRKAAPAPVRTASVEGPRQLFYRAGRFAVRLRTEQEPSTGRVSLVGQVIDEQKPDDFMPGVTVMVFSGSEAIDRTLTNRLGEFAFEGAPAHEPLQLAIGLAREGFLTVAVPIKNGVVTR